MLTVSGANNTTDDDHPCLGQKGPGHFKPAPGEFVISN